MKEQSEESKLEAICVKMGIGEQYNKMYDNPAQKEVYAVNANLTTGAIKELLRCMPNETVIKLVEASYGDDKTTMSVSYAYQLAGDRLKKLKNISEDNLEKKIFELRTKRNCKIKAKDSTRVPAMVEMPEPGQQNYREHEYNNSESVDDIPED